MDIETISKRLAALVDPHSAEVKASRQKHRRFTPQKLASDLARELEPLMAQQPEFIERPHRWLSGINCGGNVGSKWAASVLTYATIVERGDPATVTRQYAEALTLQTASCAMYCCLWGIEPKTEIALSNDVTLARFDSLPCSYEKHCVCRELADTSPPRMFRDLRFPDSVLIKTFPPAQLYFDSPQRGRDNEYIAALQELDRITHCLTVIGPSAPIRAITWCSFPDERLRLVASTGASFVGSSPEAFPGESSVLISEDSESVAKIVSMLLALSGDDRDKINISLSRLNRAIRRRDDADRALDLAIALETLLGEKDGGGDLAHRVSTRAAQLSPGDRKQKRRVRGVVKAAYNLRNDVAHSGHVKPQKSVWGKPEPTHKIIDEAISICGRIIRQIGELKQIPHWDVFDVDAETVNRKEIESLTQADGLD